jgi:hypothetical protein
VSGVDGYEPLPSDSEKEARDKDLNGEALRRLIPDWVRSGRMLKGIHLDPAEYRGVQHGLKRKPQGWVLHRVVADDGAPNANFCISESTSDAAKITFCNNGSAVGVTIDVWVY